MADAGPEATWESRKPPVFGFVVALLIWIAWSLVCLGLAPTRWTRAWFPFSNPIAYWLWWALSIASGVQTVRVALWSRTWRGGMALLGFLLILAVQVVLYYVAS